ncbi:nucleotide exchange factor GrpE [Halomonas sp. C05BenzN]|uniref:nucleotide exchange factor GrpE n=1 Tax=Halomonas sp. C05BenzN TaxID=3411041 RepID=UPI003B9411C7
MTKPIDGTDVYVTHPINLHDAILARSFPLKCTRQWQCSRCRGVGSLVAPPPYGRVRCGTCKGHGSVPRTETLSVVPDAGQRDSRAMQFRYPGEGNCGFRGGQPGDLFVTVAVTPDERFEIRGKDLVCRIRKDELFQPLPSLGKDRDTSPPLVEGFYLQTDGQFVVKGRGGYQWGNPTRGSLVYVLSNHAPLDAGSTESPKKKSAEQAAAIAAIASELLPSIDSLEKARDAMRGPTDADHREGLELILDMQRKVLARHGIEVIPAAGRVFDPHWHEAVALDTEAGAPKNRVTRVLQTGYRHGQRLLRPARVMVSG